MTNQDANKQTETNLREIFRNMDAHRAQEIREAYYKVMDGLHALIETLEEEDAKQTPTAGPMLDEHYRACQAMDVMRESELGSVL